MRGLSRISGWREKKLFNLKKCANFYEFRSEITKNGSLLQNLRKNSSWLTNSRVITSILEVSGLELHSSGTEPVTFFGGQFSLGGAQFSFGGHKQWFGGRGPRLPPRCWACCNFTAIYRTVTIAFSLKRLLKIGFIEEMKTIWGNKEVPQTFFSISFAKKRCNSFDSVRLSTLHLQFCDITKGKNSCKLRNAITN